MPPSGGAPKISKINEAVIRIAGNSQDGIQAIGGFLARLAGRSEQEVMTFMTIPSTISGGPSIFQVRIGSGEVLSAGDEADVLLAFYQHSYEDHIKSLKQGGIVLYDSDHVQPNPEWEERLPSCRHSDFRPDGRGHRRHGQGQGQKYFRARPDRENVRPQCAETEKLIGERFGGKDPSIVQNALDRRSTRGYTHSLGKSAGDVQVCATARKKGRPSSRDERQRGARLRFASPPACVSARVIPITPWSDIMELLRRELPKYGGTFVQTEDEIAAISMAIGAQLRRARRGHRFERSGNFA